MTVEELLKQLEPLIQAKAKKATIPNMEWEDVAQELRVKVWKEYKKFVNGKSKPETFFNSVSRNLIINMHRDQSRPFRRTGSLEDMLEGYEYPLRLSSDFEDTSDWLQETNLMKCWDHDVLERMVAFEKDSV